MAVMYTDRNTVETRLVVDLSDIKDVRMEGGVLTVVMSRPTHKLETSGWVHQGEVGRNYVEKAHLKELLEKRLAAYEEQAVNAAREGFYATAYSASKCALAIKCFLAEIEDGEFGNS